MERYDKLSVGESRLHFLAQQRNVLPSHYTNLI